MNSFIQIIQDKKIRGLAGIFTCCLFASQAHAAVISTSTTTVSGANISGLNLFDPALGTLTEVNILGSLSYTFDIDLSTYVIDTAQPHQVDAVVGVAITLIDDSAGVLIDVAAENVPFNCSSSGSISCTGSISPQQIINSSTVNRTITSSNLLSIFTGSGNIDFLQLESIPMAVDFLSSNNIDESRFHAGSSLLNLNADITVTYNYSPVPIPAAIWFFGSGLLSMIVIARRKQER